MFETGEGILGLWDIVSDAVSVSQHGASIKYCCASKLAGIASIVRRGLRFKYLKIFFLNVKEVIESSFVLF